jgi:hypothetical protein
MNLDKNLIRHWANLCEGTEEIGDLEPTSEELDFVGDPDDEEQRTRSNIRNQMAGVDDRVEFRDKLKKHGDVFQDAMLYALAYMYVHGDRKEIQGAISNWAGANRKKWGGAVEEVAKNLRGYLSRVDAGDVEYRYSKNDVYEADC